jgi:hypothetical protein
MRTGLIGMGLGAAVLALLLVSTESKGATITHNETTITVSGDIETKDAAKLQQLIDRTGITTVYLNSNGGVAMEGYRLGYTLMRNDTLAIVPDGNVCLSACAIAFLGAPSKVLAGTLGFHVAWSPEDTATYSEGMKSGQLFGALTASFFFNAGYTAQLPFLISQITDAETFLIINSSDLNLFTMKDNQYTTFVDLPDHWVYERVADPLRMYLLRKGY